MIDSKSFFDVPIKNKKQTYETNFEMSKNNDYITGNLLDYDFSNPCKLIAIDLSQQIELEKSDLKQQIKFIGKPEEDNEATIFFIIEKSEENTFKWTTAIKQLVFLF